MLANKNNHLIKQILRKGGGSQDTSVSPTLEQREAEAEAPIQTIEQSSVDASIQPSVEQIEAETEPTQSEYPDTKYLYRNIQNLNYPSTKTYVCAFHLATNFVKYIVETKDSKVEFPSFDFENIQKGGFLDDDIESGDLDMTFQNNVIEFVQTFFADASLPMVASVMPSPQSLSEEGSPQSFGEEGSPQSFGEEGSPQSFGEEGSPQPLSEEGSPQSLSVEGSPQSLSEEGSPQSLSEEGSQQPLSEEGSPQPLSVEGSPQSLSEEVSSPIKEKPLAKGGYLEQAPRTQQIGEEAIEKQATDKQASEEQSLRTQEMGMESSEKESSEKESSEKESSEKESSEKESSEKESSEKESFEKESSEKQASEEQSLRTQEMGMESSEKQALRSQEMGMEASEKEATDVFAVAEKPEYIGFVKGQESSIYVFVKISSDYNLKPEYNNSILNELFHTNKVYDKDVDESVRTLFENNTWLLDDKEPYSGYLCKFAEDGQLANVKDDDDDAGELINVDSMGDYYYFSFLPIDMENAKQYKRFAIFPNEYVCIHNASQMADYKENKSAYAQDKSIYFKDTEGREFFAVKTPSQFVKE